MSNETESRDLVRFNAFEAQFNDFKDAALMLRTNGHQDKEALAEVKKAKAICVSLRTGIERVRKELKAKSLEWGKKVDGEAKRLAELVAPTEQYLAAEIKKVEDELDQIRRAEEIRLDALCKERCSYLAEKGVTPNPAVVRTMTDEEWAQAKNDADAHERHQQELQRQREEEEEKLREQAESDRKAREQAEAAQREADQQREAAQREAAESDRKAKAAEADANAVHERSQRHMTRLSELAAAGITITAEIVKGVADMSEQEFALLLKPVEVPDPAPEVIKQSPPANGHEHEPGGGVLKQPFRIVGQEGAAVHPEEVPVSTVFTMIDTERSTFLKVECIKGSFVLHHGTEFHGGDATNPDNWAMCPSTVIPAAAALGMAYSILEWQMAPWDVAFEDGGQYMAILANREGATLSFDQLSCLDEVHLKHPYLVRKLQDGRHEATDLGGIFALLNFIKDAVLPPLTDKMPAGSFTRRKLRSHRMEAAI